MKETPRNPDKEIGIASHGRMGGRFYVKDYQVHDKLAELGNLNCFYDGILRHAVIKEDWQTDSVWVMGKFHATTKQLMTWTGRSRTYVRILLSKLIKEKIIVMADDGSYDLPMYKRKEDEGVRVSDMQSLNEKVAALEMIVRDLLTKAKTPIPKEDGIIVLSCEKVISAFYKGIGQARIAAKKREKARKVYKKLRADFTAEEITFAVHWTLENASEQPYDFALIADTIGQALAAREEAESIQKAQEERQKAVVSEREEIEEQESEKDDLEFYKAELPEEEREKLRERAVKELKDSGKYPDQFMSDILVGIKENEILRSQFPKGVPSYEQIPFDD